MAVNVLNTGRKLHIPRQEQEEYPTSIVKDIILWQVRESFLTYVVEKVYDI